MTIVQSLIGARLSRRTQVREHILGTSVFDTADPKANWIYVFAPGVVGSGVTVGSIDGSFNLTATGGAISTGGTAFAAGDYGWAKQALV